jgi:hypothetical protein
MPRHRPFCFLLPHLIEKNLIPDNSHDYALLTYDRDVISDAARQVVPHICHCIDQLQLHISKKRIELALEFLSWKSRDSDIVIGLSIRQFSVM